MGNAVRDGIEEGEKGRGGDKDRRIEDEGWNRVAQGDILAAPESTRSTSGSQCPGRSERAGGHC
jgi:hypothetical protein